VTHSPLLASRTRSPQKAVLNSRPTAPEHSSTTACPLRSTQTALGDSPLETAASFVGTTRGPIVHISGDPPREHTQPPSLDMDLTSKSTPTLNPDPPCDTTECPCHHRATCCHPTACQTNTDHPHPPNPHNCPTGRQRPPPPQLYPPTHTITHQADNYHQRHPYHRCPCPRLPGRLTSLCRVPPMQLAHTLDRTLQSPALRATSALVRPALPRRLQTPLAAQQTGPNRYGH
jgi:hypothetical protein